MDWRRGKPKQIKLQPGLMKYTAIAHRIRKIEVVAETDERATTLFNRRLEPGEQIISVQHSLL